MSKTGTLFVIATPIGNIKDISLRALEVLKGLKYLLCEDTRTTRKLLNYYKLGSKELISFYKDVEKNKVEKVLNILKTGEDVGLVSEAGTPILSDPGATLVRKCHEEGIKVVPIPGASALTATISASGINASSGFVFLGFLPKKDSEKERILNTVSAPLPLIIFESPHRVKSTLSFFLKLWGDCECFIARELTKAYEELKWTNLTELLKRENFKGEITLVILPPAEKKSCSIEQKTALKRALEVAKCLTSQGLEIKEAVKRAAKAFDLSPKEVYSFYVKQEKSKT